MPTKINKIARELNVGVSTAAEFLRKNNVQVDDNPNARIDDHAVELLFKEYSKDKDFKDKLDKALNRTSARKAAAKETAAAAPKPAKETVTPAAHGPKVIGKVNLDSKGNVVPPAPKVAEKPKQEPKPAPKPEPNPNQSRNPGRNPKTSRNPNPKRKRTGRRNQRLIPLKSSVPRPPCRHPSSRW